MRRMRFVTLLFLALSVAFFFVQEFRWGLCSQSLLFLEGAEGSPARRLGQMCLASGKDFGALGRAAEQSGDAASLAFAAIHPGPDWEEKRVRWADLAVAKDPQYTWVYYHVAPHGMEAGKPGVAEQIAPLVEKVAAWDPENAAVWLRRAEVLRHRATDWPKRSALTGPDSPYLQELGKRAEWMAAMERAFDSPRYDTYGQKRFELERRVMREQSWASPSTMLIFVFTYPIPHLLNVRTYAELRVAHGAKAEQAGRTEEALGHYRSVATFGRRMRLDAKTFIEELVGIAVERIGTEPLLALLQKTNRREEAAQVELAQEELQRAHSRARGHDPLTASSMYHWSALLVTVSGLLVVVFGGLTLLCVGYVNLKQWIRREKRGRIYRLMTAAENYLPVLLFLSCAGLYLVHMPYATNFQHYMTASGEITNFEPFSFNALPNPLNGYNNLPVERPFRGYAGWALGFGLAAVLLAGAQEWRARQGKGIA